MAAMGTLPVSVCARSSPDAWMRIENPVAFLPSFALGSTTVGEVDQASRQQRFRCLGVVGTGSAVVDHLCERRPRRGGTAPISRPRPGRPGWHMCNWRREGPVASAVDYSRFFFWGSITMTRKIYAVCEQAEEGERASFMHRRQAELLAVSDEIDGPPTNTVL